MIFVENLSKTFQVSSKQPGFKGTLNHFFNRKMIDVKAVEDISFSINEGEIVGFLGANGAGKTTTLKMLCGLIHPTSGFIDVAGFSPKLRKIDFLRKITLVMGQKQQLLWDLPALDSLKVNAAIYGINNREMRRRINELSEMLELGEELTRPMRKLSLGQRMKTELLASLLHKPSVLFLDEPTLGLDVNAQAKVRGFLTDYNKKTGATIILTSHYMADITALCPRVLLIHRGKIFHDGLLSELTKTLSPNRLVRLELRNEVSKDMFARYGEVEIIDKKIARLTIPKKDLISKVSLLLSEFDVTDLSVKDLPIDELIGKVFKEGKVK